MGLTQQTCIVLCSWWKSGWLTDGWVIFFFFAKRNIALSVLISKTIFQCIQFASNMTYDRWVSVPFSQSADLSYDIFLYMIFKMTFYASILILTYFGIVSELHLINCFLHQCCPCAVFVLRPVPEGHRSERHSSVKLGCQFSACQICSNAGSEGRLQPGGHCGACVVPAEKTLQGACGSRHPAGPLSHCLRPCYWWRCYTWWPSDFNGTRYLIYFPPKRMLCNYNL